MGEVPVRETHEESLSGMSYVWRWAGVHWKLLLSVAGSAVLFSAMLAVLLYGTQTKRVTIVADGAEIQAVTMKATVGETLEEQGVSVGEYDELSLPLSAAVEDGVRLTVERAFPVNIATDGRTIRLHTVAANVAQVLEKAGVQLGPRDKVQPSAFERLTAAADLKVIRVKRVVEETEHSLPFETVKREDGTLLKGNEKVVQQGQDGVLVKQIERIYEDGVLVSEQVLAREVEKESLAKIVAVGTKTPPPPAPPVKPAVAVLSAETKQVTLDGMTFGVKSVLKNVTLTAYSAGIESTGKKKGESGYGITYTGTTVTEGRTISVDPDMIPLGWWVYIDGIGFRRAEDTGSAVQGKKLDIYFDNHSHAEKFGTKKGFTVYVIGPKKPVAN